MLDTKQLTKKQFQQLNEIAAGHQDMVAGTLAVYEHLKTMNIKASDHDIRNQSLIIVDATAEAFWAGETIGDWLAPKGPFDDIDQYFTCMYAERRKFSEFIEEFLDYGDAVNAPSTNVKQ